MKRGKGVLVAVLSLLAVVPVLVLVAQDPRRAWPTASPKDVGTFIESWRVVEPITRRNLTIYPVVSRLRADTSGFLTLDEGVASGAVRIAERGQLESAIFRSRPRRDRWPPTDEGMRPDYGGGASVNELVLVNNSSQPLILLAGEVVSGGKQHRIIGADLVVQPKSDPLPLTVFCVEHGRWTAGGEAFGSAKAMAHPSIRKEAQLDKSQSGVWRMVERSEEAAGAPSPTSSYLDVLRSPSVRRAVEDVAVPIEEEYERKLRDEIGGRGAVGVVVAINGALVWSDIFPSAELLRKYWPKLLRSYVMEAEGRPEAVKAEPSVKEAAAFLEEYRGRVTLKVEPGAYRRTEISAAGYQILALEALEKSDDSGLLIHYNKMARD